METKKETCKLRAMVEEGPSAQDSLPQATLRQTNPAGELTDLGPRRYLPNCTSSKDRQKINLPSFFKASNLRLLWLAPSVLHRLAKSSPIPPQFSFLQCSYSLLTPSLIS